MRLGFISDTHGGFTDTVRALAWLSGCDRIFHLGDVLYHGPRNNIPGTYDPKVLAELLKDRTDITYVRGNCDADVDEMVTGQDLSERERLVHVGDQTVYLVHGFRETDAQRLERARQLQATILASGHTHVKVLDSVGGITVINPGSTTIPKDGSKSCALWEDGRVTFFNLETNEIIQA